MIVRLLDLYFVLLITEGALRKWVVSGFDQPILIAKVIVLWAAFVTYASLFREDPHSVNQHQAPKIMPVQQLWLLFAIFTIGLWLVGRPNALSTQTLLYYLGPLPLVALVPYWLNRPDIVFKLLDRLLILGLINCVVGIFQYNSPADSWINVYANDTENIAILVDENAGFGRARITGLFSFITANAFFLLLTVFISFQALLATSMYRRLLGLTTLTLGFVNLAMTGSRGPLIVGALLMVWMFASLLSREQREKGDAKFAISAAVLALMGMAVLAGPVLDAVISRNAEAGDGEGRFIGSLLMPFFTLTDMKFFGWGVGNSVHVLFTEFVEVQHDRAGMELGVVGYLILLALKIWAVVMTWKMIGMTQDSRLKMTLRASLAFQLSLVWQIPVFQPITFALYLGCVGLVLGMLQLAEQQQQLFAQWQASVGAMLNSGAARLAPDGSGLLVDVALTPEQAQALGIVPQPAAQPQTPRTDDASNTRNTAKIMPITQARGV